MGITVIYLPCTYHTPAKKNSCSLGIFLSTGSGPGDGSRRQCHGRSTGRIPWAFGGPPADGAAVTQRRLEQGRLQGWPVSGMALDYRKCVAPMPQGSVFEVCGRRGWRLVRAFQGGLGPRRPVAGHQRESAGAPKAAETTPSRCSDKGSPQSPITSQDVFEKELNCIGKLSL